MNFKKCSGCGHDWDTRDGFMSDPLVNLIGYQVNFDALETGYFMFNHLDPECLTTLALHTGLFRDLYHGEVYHEKKTGSVKCPGHCQISGNLKVCTAKCECSFVREVMRIVLRWPKGAAA